MTPNDQPDPRRKRAFLLGGALLAGIVVWNGPWWDDDDDRVVITTDAESGEEIRARVREEIREGIREATRGERATIEDATDPSGEASAETPEDDPVLRIEGEDGRGVTISVDPADGAEDGGQ